MSSADWLAVALRDAKLNKRVERRVGLLGHQRVAGVEHDGSTATPGLRERLGERAGRRAAASWRRVGPTTSEHRAAHLRRAFEAVRVGVAGA